MSQCRSSNAHKRAQTQKAAVIDNDRLKKLNAAVAKINMQLQETDSDNENGTDSSYDLSDFSSENYKSDSDTYLLQKHLLVGVIFLKQF